VISNPNNAQIRAVRKLRKRRERERRSAMLVEGRRALGVAIQTGCPVIELLHTPAALQKRPEMVRQIRASGAKVLEVSPEVMATIAGVGSVPDVVGVVPLRETSLDDAASAFGFGAVLAGVHDPAAAASILASCAAAGGSVAIATTGTTDLFAPKPVRSAAGAHFLLRVAAGVDPAACAESLRSAGVRLVTLDADGEELEASSLQEPLAIVVGEDGTIPEPLASQASGRVRIGDPKAGIRPPVAAEAAVVLFEAGRRHRDGKS